MRKLSLVLVLTLLMSCMTFIPTSATGVWQDGTSEAASWTAAEGWNVMTTTGSQTVTKKANVVSTQHNSGSYALSVYYGALTSWAYAGGGYIRVYTDALKLEDGAEYTMTFYEKGDGTEDLAVAPFVGYISDGAVKAVHEKYLSGGKNGGSDGLVLVEGSGGTVWRRFTYTFTYDASKFLGKPRVGFVVRNGNYSSEYTYYFDDITLTKTGSSENLISNPGFEPISYNVTDNWTAVETVGKTAYMPKQISFQQTTVHDGKSSIAVEMGATPAGVGSNYYNGNGHALLVADAVTLEEGKEYVLTFWEKGDNCGDACNGFYFGSLADGTYTIKNEFFLSGKGSGNGLVLSEGSGGEWRKFTYTFTYTKDSYGENPHIAFGEDLTTGEQVRQPSILMIFH